MGTSSSSSTSSTISTRAKGAWLGPPVLAVVAAVTIVAILVAAAVAAAVVASVVAGRADADDARGAADDVPTITMSGSGRTSVVPDEVTFDLQVRASRAELDQALADANRRMSGSVDRLIRAGVAREDIQTSGLEMRPTYRRVKGRPAVPTGYAVTQSTRVTADLKTAGGAVTAVVDGGDDKVTVGGLSLGVGDEAAATVRARDGAIRESRAKAEQYARAAGRDLGAAITVREPEATGPGPEVSYSATASDMSGKQTPVLAGEEELAVQVEVVWELR